MTPRAQEVISDVQLEASARRCSIVMDRAEKKSTVAGDVVLIRSARSPEPARNPSRVLHRPHAYPRPLFHAFSSLKLDTKIGFSQGAV